VTIATDVHALRLEFKRRVERFGDLLGHKEAD